MVPFFLGRPLLGLLVGMLVFAASQGKLLFRVDCQDEPSLYRMVFYSLLAGLFAKSLIERLKAVFDKIFGA
jgi:hypothetical protein